MVMFGYEKIEREMEREKESQREKRRSKGERKEGRRVRDGECYRERLTRQSEKKST